MPAVNDFKMFKSSHFNLKPLTLALMVVFSGACGAQTTPAPASLSSSAAPPAIAGATQTQARVPTSQANASSAVVIQEINESMTVLSAQLMQLDLKAKIAAKRKEILSLEAPVIPVIAAKPAVPVRPSGPVDANGIGSSPVANSLGMPSVVSVSGLKGRLEAVLVFNNGLVRRVRSGDIIGDKKVGVIALNNVEFTDLNGSNSQRLPFGTSPIIREYLGRGSMPQAVPVAPVAPVAQVAPMARAVPAAPVAQAVPVAPMSNAAQKMPNPAP